jgi:hypothetical protein
MFSLTRYAVPLRVRPARRPTANSTAPASTDCQGSVATHDMDRNGAEQGDRDGQWNRVLGVADRFTDG